MNIHLFLPLNQIFNDKKSYGGIEIEGHRVEITSNLYLEDSTYTLDTSGDYRRLLNYLAGNDIRHKIMHDYTDIQEEDY